VGGPHGEDGSGCSEQAGNEAHHHRSPPVVFSV
jgi:hypothetical protein